MITITRYFRNNKITLGVMDVDGLDLPIYTLELPWKNNERNISCISKGNYTIKPHISPTHGKCFSIEGVINRDYILIHSGNVSSEIRGCILVGMSAGYLKNNYAVLSSRKALQTLLKHIKEPTELIIKNLYV
jgi:hypothetical protein